MHNSKNKFTWYNGRATLKSFNDFSLWGRLDCYDTTLSQKTCMKWLIVFRTVIKGSGGPFFPYLFFCFLSITIHLSICPFSPFHLNYFFLLFFCSIRQRINTTSHVNKLP